MAAINCAYSTFPELLAELRLSVADAHKRLLARGAKFDKKSLYRLASHKPLQTLNAPLIGAICAEFNINLGDLLVWSPPKPQLHRIDERTQARLDALMGKNNEGTLTSAECRELTQLGEVVERLSLENAKMLGRHAQTQRRQRAAARASATRPKRKPS